MVTLFRAGTLEDWTEVFYINYWGCNVYDDGIYHPVGVVQQFELQNSVCDAPEQRRLDSIVYFFSFIIICLAMFAMVSL